jgi:hypothetical protein
MPVRSLTFVSGEAHDSLLVFGGQGQDQPEMLTLLPLPPPAGDKVRCAPSVRPPGCSSLLLDSPLQGGGSDEAVW